MPDSRSCLCLAALRRTRTLAAWWQPWYTSFKEQACHECSKAKISKVTYRGVLALHGYVIYRRHSQRQSSSSLEVLLLKIHQDTFWNALPYGTACNFTIACSRAGSCTHFSLIVHVALGGADACIRITVTPAKLSQAKALTFAWYTPKPSES